jgi:FkbM family methyltransferase
MQGEFDPHVIRVLEDLVKPGMNAVDVGANCGWFTLVMAARLGRSGRLDAIEPDPDHTKLMNMSLAANGFADWVHVHGAAAVESDRPVDLYRNPVNRGNHCIHANAAEGTREKIGVPGIALDSILTHPVQVMKLDAEGSEPLVLAGMRQTLTRSPEMKIVMEFYPELIQQGGTDPAQFLREIEAMGFSYHLITMAGELESCHPDFLLSEGQISNLLLTR